MWKETYYTWKETHNVYKEMHIVYAKKLILYLKRDLCFWKEPYKRDLYCTKRPANWRFFFILHTVIIYKETYISEKSRVKETYISDKSHVKETYIRIGLFDTSLSRDHFDISLCRDVFECPIRIYVSFTWLFDTSLCRNHFGISHTSLCRDVFECQYLKRDVYIWKVPCERDLCTYRTLWHISVQKSLWHISHISL